MTVGEAQQVRGRRAAMVGLVEKLKARAELHGAGPDAKLFRRAAAALEPPDIVSAALNAEEAYEACVRRFKVHKSSYGGVVVRVTESEGDPANFEYGAPIPVNATIKYWDFGDEKMATDFVRLQGWKAAAQKLLAHD